MEIKEQDIVSSLKKSLSEVFENMAFTEIETFDQISTPPPVTSRSFAGWLSIEAPLKADFGLIIPERFLFNILQSTLDESQLKDWQKMEGDLISEYCNTIAGDFMKNLLPPDKDFDLSLPNYKRGESPAYFYEKREMITLALTVESDKIYCVLGLE
jgi:CheY-specific phosphatase CheX